MISAAAVPTMWLATAVPVNFAMMIVLSPGLVIGGSHHRSRSEFDLALAIAALEPVAAQHFQATIDHVPAAVRLIELAWERLVQEAPDFAFAREDVRESVEQPIVAVTQRIALHFAAAAAGEGSSQIQNVICGGRSCDHSSCSRQDKELCHFILLT